MVTISEQETDPYPAYARLRREEPVSWVPEARQWLVTGWHDVHTVLTDTERFTTDQPASPMHGVCGGTPMLLREGESHQDVREAFRHDYDAHRVNDYVDTIARPVAHRVADEVFPAGCADLAADYFEPVAAIAEATLLGVGPGGADTLRRWGQALTKVANNFGRDPAVDTEAAAVMADDAAVTAAVQRLREQPDGSVISHLLHANRRGEAQADADVLPVLKHIALSVIEPAWLDSGGAVVGAGPARRDPRRPDTARRCGGAVRSACWAGARHGT
ncbi:cytochrome P450 family protein [Lentzea terrae]|uniref:hypothetical protein n=1 Tax=Lentzea terrae TaxID=2200761 RepID=UPI0013006A51|nr:hypothetical protein [Lentzea terrae]